MNSLLLIIIGIPAVEVFLMIKVGQQLGALNTILLIFLTAIIGIYFAKIQGLNTIKSGLINIYQNKIPMYEFLSGASIAFAAFLLILPGFLTDLVGFIILIPFTRSILIKMLIKKNYKKNQNNSDIIDGEIVDKKDKDEL
tara:strand:- start:2036 stop:2455 length:420 start_codon:yes stop_codon:yes gene_type:complete